MNIDYSKSQKHLIFVLPKLTMEERIFQYDLAKKIIDRNRQLGKHIYNSKKIK